MSSSKTELALVQLTGPDCEPQNEITCDYPLIPEKATTWEKLKIRYIYLIQISKRCPATIDFFNSETSIQDEKKRHYQHFRYIIHPLSKFNCYYQIFCLFFYGLLVFFKAFDFGFIGIVRNNNDDQTVNTVYDLLIFALVLDLIALINIVIQFWIGYGIKNSSQIILSRKLITKRYIVSGLFFCDLLSSIPRLMVLRTPKILQLLIVTLNLLKMVRITTVINLIKPSAMYMGIKSSTKMFLSAFFIIIAVFMHIMTCLHAGITQYRDVIAPSEVDAESYEHYYRRSTLRQRYMMMFFKSAQYTLLISVQHTGRRISLEDTVVGFFNYFVGKFLIIAIWIVLLFTFVNQRMLRVKFEEIITELNEYMKSKNLPENLRKRMVTFYQYKYQRVFFNESAATKVLSENLKREIDVFLCKSLIHQVTIFRNISPKVVKRIITYLVPQIFLPNDLIIQSGTIGESMYFIESGTVAVHTNAGKEICHLQDGAYFGEVAVVLNNEKRPYSVTAIEITRVYVLSRTHFQRCFRPKDFIFKLLAEAAEKNIQTLNTIDEIYKSGLFMKTHGALG